MALAILLSLGQPLLAQNVNGHLTFTNKLSKAVTVDILKSGVRQKGETIQPGATHQFDFGAGNCSNKNREFRMQIAATGQVFQMGSFQFKGTRAQNADDTYCLMRFQKPVEYDNNPYEKSAEHPRGTPISKQGTLEYDGFTSNRGSVVIKQ
jgi:hypothetical protein